ncbi:hypothetical protein HGI30_16720 [Paenibacillus albicereus]|uniref:Phage tail tape measure protein n=1 Tax=Paenibacillus albicereus TaxID=2726185 RepID=A0A6H2H039_9BACL|nr:hypothetical protein [Paenibacillus albicereus]QJC53054.1 hypothetical protein HGI30_16720 [Paenibacillus albicereus]
MSPITARVIESEVSSVSITVDELKVLITAETAGLKRELKDVRRVLTETDKTTGKVTASIKSHLASIGTALAAIGAGAGFLSAAKDAMKFEAAVQQVNRMMGESTTIFRQWVTGQAAAFGMGISEATQYGATYANLISGFSADQAETTKRTIDLLQASAIVASATGRSISDVMERIRSGMLGETDAVEDLGINVNVAMLESTNAFRQFAGDQSWAQLSFQTQQTILYFAILEQAARKYGNELAANTATRQAAFIAQLKNARLYLGQAFLPIYNAVLPALTAMAKALATAMMWLAAFTTALFGGSGAAQQVKAAQDQATAAADIGGGYKDAGEQAKKAGDAAAKAGKKAKGAVAGFDKLNLVGEKPASGGADAAGVADPAGVGAAAGGMWDAASFSGITDGMDGVVAKAQEMAAKVKDAIKAMSDFIRQHKDSIIAALAGLAAGFAAFFLASRWAAIVAAVQRVWKVLTSLRLVFAALGGPVALIAAAVAGLTAAFVYFYRTNDSFKGAVDGILRQIGVTAKWLWNDVLKPFAAWYGQAFVAAWKQAGDALSTLYTEVLQPVGQWLGGKLLSAWKSLQAGMSAFYNELLVPLAGEFREFYQQTLKPFGSWLADKFLAAWEGLKAVVSEFWSSVLKPFLNDLAAGWQSKVEPIIAALKDRFAKGWDTLAGSVGSFSERVLQPCADALKWLYDKVLVPLASIIGGALKIAWDTISTIAASFYKNVIIPLANLFLDNFIPALEAIEAVFKAIYENALKPLGKYLAEGFKVTVENIIKSFTWLWKNVLEPLATFVGGALKITFTNTFEGLKGVINGVSKILTGLLTFITGVFTGDWKKAWQGVVKVFDGIFGGLWAIIKVPLNMIIDGINAVIGGINRLKIDLPDWVQKVTGYSSFGFNIPRIPKLAEGGLAYGPTLAMVGDNRGAAADPEVISPLSKLEGIIAGAGAGNNREVVSLLTSLLQAVKGGGKDIVLQIGETELGRAAARGINTIQRQTGVSPLRI